jgi:hypothetical protein
VPDVEQVLATARCGDLTVPENRNDPGGRTISLAVAIVPAQSPTPAPDPIVHMTGGPAASTFSRPRSSSRRASTRTAT